MAEKVSLLLVPLGFSTRDVEMKVLPFRAKDHSFADAESSPTEFKLRIASRPYHDKTLAVVRLIDGLAVYLCLWVAAAAYRVEWQSHYAWLGVLAVILYECFAEYNEIYYFWRSSSLHKHLPRIFFSWFLAFNVLIVITFILKTTATYSRVLLCSWFFLAFAAIAFSHYARRAIQTVLRKNGRDIKRLGIVGCNELGNRLSAVVEEMPWLGYELVGFYDDRSYRGGRVKYQESLIGNLMKLYNDVLRGELDIVFITLPLRAESRIREILDALSDSTISVYYVPDFSVFDLLYSRWDTIQGIPIISIYDSPFTSLDASLKRLEDLVLSIIVLLVAAIPMALIALGVKMTSAGPVLFKQVRYGIHGEEIEIYKFRTMALHEEGGNIRQASRNDPRVTRFGAFLRRNSLDELPQFINVLQGRMSVVGPRPHAVSHNEYYRKLIQGYMLRHKVRPGITGLAQINGYRGETDTVAKMERRIRMDMEYIRNWSIWLDLRIVLKTILGGFRSVNAW
jgi:putative colanic acid biosynthesis UDP-glucose lipid carrier transferase